MTVRDLINTLAHLPEDAEVLIDGCSITDVIQIDEQNIVGLESEG